MTGGIPYYVRGNWPRWVAGLQRSINAFYQYRNSQVLPNLPSLLGLAACRRVRPLNNPSRPQVLNLLVIIP